MKPWSEYTNQNPYPTRDDFKITYYYKEGKLVYISIQPFVLSPNEYGAKEVVIDMEGYKAAMKVWNDETDRLRQEFEKDLYEDLRIVDNPKKELLFEKAWKDGHSSGFSEVYNVACDLVDLIQ